MTKRSHSDRTSFAELQAWYLGSLRPKLGYAAATGVVNPSAAVALDTQIRDLLKLDHGETSRAAA